MGEYERLFSATSGENSPVCAAESLGIRVPNHIVQMNQVPLPTAVEKPSVFDGVVRTELDRISHTLLQLYGLAQHCTVDTFQCRVIALLGALFDFDCAWWARGSTDGVLHRVHCSYLHELPDDVPEMLNLNDPGNLVARRTTQAPNRAIWFGPQHWLEQRSTAALAAHMGIAQAVCIASPSGHQGRVGFLSLARRSESPAFGERDLQGLELLMPHLVAALDLCCVTQMGRQHKGDGVRLVTTDSEGWLNVSEPQLEELLCQEWPQWTPPRLPTPLLQALQRRQSRFLGRRLRADIRWSGPHALVALCRLEPRDLLTAQERAAALAFASGLSYKQVAEKLNIAPSTVRHHLRSVYLKLGVSDKGALAGRMQ